MQNISNMSKAVVWTPFCFTTILIQDGCRIICRHFTYTFLLDLSYLLLVLNA